MIARESLVVRALPIIVLASAIIATTPATAQDMHLMQDSSAKLYASSAFAHGYRHGYEEGYHAADAELQLSRFTLADMQISSVPRAKGYKKDFGSKDRFKKGFEAGYRDGYADSAASVQFHLPDGMVNALASSDKDFDAGVEVGVTGKNGCDTTRMSQAFCAGIRAGRALSNRSTRTEVAVAIPNSKK